VTIRRAKPLGRGTPPKRARLKRGKGAKAERENPALEAFRFAVFERSHGYCSIMVEGDATRPFPFYDQITRTDREMICGRDGPHRGDNAHHVWPEDRDAGLHDPDRGLWVCYAAHHWIHDHPGELRADGTVTPRTAKAFGLLRPIIPEDQ